MAASEPQALRSGTSLSPQSESLLSRIFPEAKSDGRFHTIESNRLHFVDTHPAGDSGSPILMVHGNPTWSFFWRDVIRRFRGEHRMIAVDHLGCGLSDKPQRYDYCLDRHISNLRSLVESLDLANVTIVAHDWGGAISMGTALQCRERISKIVLTNTACFPPPFFPLRIRVCRFPLLGQIGVQGFNLFARAATKMTTERPGGLDPDIAKGFLAPYDNWANRIATYRFVKDIPTRPSQKTWQTLEHIESGLAQFANTPVQLIWGMRDWCFRPECLDRLVERMPHANVEKIEDAGHYLIEDAPDRVLDTMANFLAG